MKRLTDPAFKYTPSVETDLKKTFARVRKQLQRDQADCARREQVEADRRAALDAKVHKLRSS